MILTTLTVAAPSDFRGSQYGSKLNHRAVGEEHSSPVPPAPTSTVMTSQTTRTRTLTL